MALALTLQSLTVQGQGASNYRGLRKVIRSNVGFAHLTRGVNMDTLVALRTCVGTNDVGVLGQMLTDRDPLVRMASAYVLADLGSAGQQVLAEQIKKTVDPGRRSVLTEALRDVASATYRPILNYARPETAQHRIRSCPRR